jgi:hypothetical protein
MAMKKKTSKGDPAAAASKKQKLTGLMQKGMTTPTFDGTKNRPKKKMGSYNADNAPKKSARTYK